MQSSPHLLNDLAHAIAAAHGWLPFDAFMSHALYAPGLGYYANESRKFGALPASGSDFITAPELSAFFGTTLAVQVAQALAVTQTQELWEFGAGSGALAWQLLTALDAAGTPVSRYTVVELSGSLRARQQAKLAAYGDRVRWVSELPAQMHGVVLGNELLDALPVKLLARQGGVWHERGVVWREHRAAAHADSAAEGEGALVFDDRPTDLRPPLEIPGEHDYLCEIHPQAEAFVRTLAGKLVQGAAFFIDYGFTEREYYHPQRHMGTLMCHHRHRADANPLQQVGEKDITAHVNFTGIALAAQAAGLAVLGYTSQARFLMNCGLLTQLAEASLAQRAQAQKLLTEHEMGELFKVIGFAKGAAWDAVGFAQGDRTHTL
ncbi:MAG: class I SAM-dependent methyltransferase [Burkholderiaceae bacterium]